MTDANVLIIGGGAMGVSLMYHLAKSGWSDVFLTEKNDLTHGSTWHAAGLCTLYAHNRTIQALRATSVRLYRDILPEETGQGCGFHPSGAMRITSVPDRMAEFSHVAGLSKFTGHELRLLTPEEVTELYPLASGGGILGGIYEPDDGHVDPSLVTNAMASVARQHGATIMRQNPVRSIRREGTVWVVETEKVTIRTRHIVNAAGTWGWEVGGMMGLNIPSVPMLHQYLVTDTVPDIADRMKQGLPELPMIRDPDESWYVRQERDGLILGPYEKQGLPWSIDGCPPEFGAELMPPDLERIEDIVMAAMERVPALASGGIKSIVNGPITFTPDASPLIGPAHGLTNAWLLTGSSMGVMEGGGAGWFLAHWMTHGAPPMDPLAVDPRRFGAWADRDYRVEKAVEAFGEQFGIHYPHEERKVGRGKRLSAIHDQMLERGAVMGTAYGWERPNWFSTYPGNEAENGFQRVNWFSPVARECAVVASRVGLADLSPFSKFDVTGPDAQTFVDALGTNRAPAVGRIGLTYALTPEGGVLSEFTVSTLSEEHFYLTCAAAAEEMGGDLMRARTDGFDVTITNVTDNLGAVGLMGPKARDVLSALTDHDLSEDFPWLSVRRIEVAGIELRALRVSYVGELGWELHAPKNDLPALFLALEEAGKPHGLGFFGAYAMNAMRLEKGYRAWGSDLITERTPIEAGMGFLVKPDNREYVGKDALLTRMRSNDRWEMVLLEIDSGEVDPFHGHSVHRDGETVGIVTSGGWGPRTARALGLAYLRQRDVRERLEVEILGRSCPARVLKAPPYDPTGERMKA
ncbi:GcvT family protein [Roseovarius nitratireducens]|uniref:GcvT family protein n=1 Tax=Roseovarius nitratireducens TaxID=2044597 RepID=UPI000CE208DF|nr:FAD-dependent oxidoreductase [Roseovarius nitratireducens]